MIITQKRKLDKLTSISLTFDTDEEIGCLEDIVALVENEHDSKRLREELIVLITTLKKVL